MTIALHGSSPPIVNVGDGVNPTTAPFSPPANSVLTAAIGTGFGASATINISGGGLTWTQRVTRTSSQRVLRIWTAPCPAGASNITVTVTGTGQPSMGLKVDVWTGVDLDAPVGQTGQTSSTVNNFNFNAYTASIIGSRGVAVALDLNNLGNPTSTDDEVIITGLTSTNGMVVRKATNAAALTTVTINCDAAGSGTPDWQTVAIELLPGGEDADVDLATVAAAASVPAPAVAIGAEPDLTTVTAVAAVPDPDLSAGSNIGLAAVAALAGVPGPVVTTEDTELVELVTVAAAADVPAPILDVSANVTLAEIEAVAALYSPTVTADAHITLSPVQVLADLPPPTIDVPVLPGDQITRPGQLEWQGFLLGSLTPYSWQELQGWIDSPPFISGNVDRPDSSGSYEGQPYYGERIINWSTLLKMPRDQVGQIVHDLLMGTGPHQDEVPGWLVIWALDGLAPRLVRAFLSKREPGPINKQARLGLMRGALQWICPDPRTYDVARSSLTIVKDVVTGVLNDGNDASPPEYRIPGPATGIQIENLTTDRVIAFDTNVLADETLIIDVFPGTVAIGDVDHKADLVEGSASIEDMVLAPGVNELVFTCTTGTVMQTLWRHAIS